MVSITRRSGLFAFAISLAVILAVSFGSATPALAGGSTKPNPPALQKSASAMADDQESGQKEASALLHRLATDAEFAKAFDAATYKRDRPALMKLLKEGGITHRVTIDSISRDLRITITIRGKGWSVTITISW